jgi:hypothetical protein
VGYPTWALAFFTFIIVVCGGAIVWLSLKRRPTPEELERLRRLTIHQGGKMGDGEIIDVEEATIIYSYSVAGVVYTASQDVKELQDRLPPDKMSIMGSVSIKFSPRNPANSIVLCEDWSGLRNR